MKYFVYILLLGVAFSGIGCPIEGDAGPVETCTEVAQQCRMSEGKLGVCTMTTDGALWCMSQH